MTERLMIAYGLMVLMVMALGAAIWWNIHYSHRRTHKRRLIRERKRVIAAEALRRQAATGGSECP